jgi:hypothetical protein
MSNNKLNPIEVFISYSHKDELYREKLGTHLSILKRQGFIKEWHDRCITAGQEWADQIDQHLNSAAVILLLVSADFLASDYCYNREMKRAIERHNAGAARVIPVILRRVDLEGAPFAHLQALPRDRKPVRAWPDEDEAFTNIAEGIRKAIREIQQKTPPVDTEIMPGYVSSAVPKEPAKREQAPVEERIDTPNGRALLSKTISSIIKKYSNGIWIFDEHTVPTNLAQLYEFNQTSKDEILLGVISDSGWKGYSILFFVTNMSIYYNYKRGWFADYVIGKIDDDEFRRKPVAFDLSKSQITLGDNTFNFTSSKVHLVVRMFNEIRDKLAQSY